MKKALSIILSAAMVLSLSPVGKINVYAADDVTEPVSIYLGESKTFGNVTVEDDSYAVYVNAYERGVWASEDSQESEPSASATIQGDVSLTNDYSEYEDYYSQNAIEAYSYDGNAIVDVSGNVSVDSTNATALDLYTYKEINAKVAGDVKAKGIFATGINAMGDNKIDVNIGKDLISEATNKSIGAYVLAQGENTIDIAGKVTSESQEAYGVQLVSGWPRMMFDIPQSSSDEKEIKTGDISLTIRDGVEVTAVKSEDNSEDYIYPNATGIAIANYDGGNMLVDVTGDVKVSGPDQAARGIATYMDYEKLYSQLCNGSENPVSEDIPEDSEGVSDIRIHGSIDTNGLGIYLYSNFEDVKTKVLVEDTIKADYVPVAYVKLNKNAILIGDSSDSSEEEEPDINLDLTAWKIIPNKDGHIAEYVDSVMVLETVAAPAEPDIKVAANFEKTINYIVKTEKPSGKSTFAVTDKDGNALEKSYDYEVAHEGDKLIVKPEMADDETLVAVYNNDGENKEELEKDDAGNYYIVVPKGGGIDISIETKENPKPTPTPTKTAKPEPTTSPAPTATPEKLEDVEKKIKKMASEADLTNAEFAKTKLKVKKVKKNSISYSWKPVEGATKYVIYANKCNHLHKCKKIAEVKGTSFTLKKIKGKKLKAGTYYKLLIVAADDENNVLSTSKVIHCATKGGNRTNYKSIKVTNVKNNKLTLKKGWSFDLEYKTKKVMKKGTIKVHRPVCFESSNTSVATVNEDGQIKAEGLGTCKIYAYTQNGKYTTINVTVKSKK